MHLYEFKQDACEDQRVLHVFNTGYSLTNYINTLFNYTVSHTSNNVI